MMTMTTDEIESDDGNNDNGEGNGVKVLFLVKLKRQ